MFLSFLKYSVQNSPEMSDFRMFPGPEGLPLGFGTWAIGGDGWGPMTSAAARNILSAAWDAGFRHFDSAEAYGNGRAEQLLGQALRSHLRDLRPQIQITTKSVVRPPGALRRHLERSLRRMGVEYIDLYYIHWPRPGISLAAAVEELERARAAGLIRYIGLSNVTPEEVREAAESGAVDAVQFGYNFLWRSPERTGLTGLREYRVAYSPLAQGLLARAFPARPQWDDGDHRRKTPLFGTDAWPEVHRFQRRFVESCKDAGIPPAAVALTWATRRVDAAVVGGRRKEHIGELCAGLAVARREAAACLALLEELEVDSLWLQERLPELPNFFGYEPTPCRGC
jgi:myo-inositol catabolism protein IolS